MSYNTTTTTSNDDNKTALEEGYDIQEEIGRGTTGIVYKIQTKWTHKKYALKKINVRHLNPKQRYNKLQEVLFIQSLEHPSIIRNYSAEIIGDDLHIIMEYAQDRDLSKVIFLEINRLLKDKLIKSAFYQRLTRGMHYGIFA